MSSTLDWLGPISHIGHRPSLCPALTAAIAHLEATFQRQVVGYWIDGSLRGYEAQGPPLFALRWFV